MASQKDVFLSGEGDAWFQRNQAATGRAEYLDHDPIIAAVAEIRKAHLSSSKLRLLEIGSSNGRRLERLRDEHDVDVAGVEPSAAATADAVSRGLDVKIGTADHLSQADASFDIVAFGFCLYLCDPADLFRIATEADRVTRSPGWIIIHDFFSRVPTERPYHHLPGVVSRKMDYRTLFDWHPHYTCYSHHVGRHQTGAFEDDPGEWVATSVLRKRAP